MNNDQTQNDLQTEVKEKVKANSKTKGRRNFKATERILPQEGKFPVLIQATIPPNEKAVKDFDFFPPTCDDLLESIETRAKGIKRHCEMEPWLMRSSAYLLMVIKLMKSARDVLAPPTISNLLNLNLDVPSLLQVIIDYVGTFKENGIEYRPRDQLVIFARCVVASFICYLNHNATFMQAWDATTFVTMDGNGSIFIPTHFDGDFSRRHTEVIHRLWKYTEVPTTVRNASDTDNLNVTVTYNFPIQEVATNDKIAYVGRHVAVTHRNDFFGAQQNPALNINYLLKGCTHGDPLVALFQPLVDQRYAERVNAGVKLTDGFVNVLASLVKRKMTDVLMVLNGKISKKNSSGLGTSGDPSQFTVFDPFQNTISSHFPLSSSSLSCAIVAKFQMRIDITYRFESAYVDRIDAVLKTVDTIFAKT